MNAPSKRFSPLLWHEMLWQQRNYKDLHEQQARDDDALPNYYYYLGQDMAINAIKSVISTNSSHHP